MSRFGVILALLLGCFVSLARADALDPRTLERPDGTHITWYLDAPLRSGFPLVVLLQGSECLTVAHKYGPMIEQLERAGIAVLRVEKPGLGAETVIGTCPEEYLRLNTVDRRVLDVLAVLAELRRKPHGWNGKLGLLGGSEGGMVASMLAPLVPELRGLVLISTGGGLTFAEEMLLTVAAQMRAAGADEDSVRQRDEEMRRSFAEIRDNPVPSKEWMSDQRLARNTWQWCAGALPIASVRPLLKVRAPILVLHGEADQSTPLESAQRMLELFAQHGKHNMTLRTYAGAGHAPTEAAIANALRWLARRLGA